MEKVLNGLQMDGETLVKEYCKTKYPKLKADIIQSFSPLIKYIVGRFNLTYSTTISQDDLYQFGIFGLLKALERYNPAIGVPFKSFAYKRIYGEVVDALRKEGMLGRDKYEQVKNLENMAEKLTAELGREPLTEEICTALSITETEYYALLNVSQMVYSTSLNTKISDDEGDFIYRIDALTDDDQMNPEEKLIKENLKERLREIIGDLPEREKLIMALYFYEELTLADIAKVVNLTEARISQILSKTLMEIRVMLNQ